MAQMRNLNQEPRFEVHVTAGRSSDCATKHPSNGNIWTNAIELDGHLCSSFFVVAVDNLLLYSWSYSSAIIPTSIFCMQNSKIATAQSQRGVGEGEECNYMRFCRFLLAKFFRSCLLSKFKIFLYYNKQKLDYSLAKQIPVLVFLFFLDSIS